MCYPSSLRVRDFYQSVKSNKIDYVSNRIVYVILVIDRLANIYQSD